MANRTFDQYQYTIDKGIVTLYCSVSVGGGGAVTFEKWNQANQGSTAAYATAGSRGFGGVLSVTRTGTGAWTLVLQDSYIRLLGVRATSFSTTGIPAAPTVGVDTDLTNVSSTTSPSIGVVLSAAGVATDPGSGERIILRITLQNSSAP